ncbi:hypothetical protein D3C71_2120480 [compost metagenome]
MTSAQAGSIRALDTMRDAAQHWMIVVPEDALFVNARALLTTLDEVLVEHFEGKRTVITPSAKTLP